MIVKSIRLAAIGEWSIECDPRVYCKGEQIELAGRSRTSAAAGRSSPLRREHILTFGFQATTDFK